MSVPQGLSLTDRLSLHAGLESPPSVPVLDWGPAVTSMSDSCYDSSVRWMTFKQPIGIWDHRSRSVTLPLLVTAFGRSG